jgi:hypothetical protein
MNKVIKTLGKLYEGEKDSENPPEFLKTVERILKV